MATEDRTSTATVATPDGIGNRLPLSYSGGADACNPPSGPLNASSLAGMCFSPAPPITPVHAWDLLVWCRGVDVRMSMRPRERRESWARRTYARLNEGLNPHVRSAERRQKQQSRRRPPFSEVNSWEWDFPMALLGVKMGDWGNGEW